MGRDSGFIASHAALASMDANLVLVPLLWLALAELEVAILLGFLFSPLALPFAALANRALDALAWVVTSIDRLPFASLQVRGLPGWGALLFYSFLIVLGIAVHARASRVVWK
jgi:hypothetical protein